MIQLSEAPLLTFHKSFKICPIDSEMFTHIWDMRGVRLVFLSRYDTAIVQTFGSCDNEWVGDWSSFQTLPLSNHGLEMTNIEYLSDNL